MVEGFYIKEKGNLIYIPHPQEMKELANSVVEQMMEKDFYPDVNIAIANGGVPPARDVDYYFMKLAGHVPEPGSVKFDSYTKGNTHDEIKDDITRINEILPEIMHPKTVLITDDLTDSGRTMRETIEWARKTFGVDADIRTAVLWHKDCSKVVPDFYGEAVDAGWILLYKDFTKPYEEFVAERVA